MISKSFLFLCICLLLGVSNMAKAQLRFSHEIGVIVGPVAFQSDYGERQDLSTNTRNSGFGIGLVHFINFASDERGYFTKDNFFNDHFKIRSELSYNKTKLNHFGQWVEGTPSLGKQQLKAMHGTAAVTNIGIQLEFFPFSIQRFTEKIGSWTPFVSLGGQYSFYNVKTASTLGSLGTPLTTFPKYLTPSSGRSYGFLDGSRSIFSIVTSVGARYKLSSISDLMVDIRWQYYFSDWVDGLNPNPNLYKENRSNDSLVWFNLGYIYYP